MESLHKRLGKGIFGISWIPAQSASVIVIGNLVQQSKYVSTNVWLLSLDKPWCSSDPRLPEREGEDNHRTWPGPSHQIYQLWISFNMIWSGLMVTSPAIRKLLCGIHPRFVPCRKRKLSHFSSSLRKLSCVIWLQRVRKHWTLSEEKRMPNLWLTWWYITVSTIFLSTAFFYKESFLKLNFCFDINKI